jgi:CHAD domain-containing protein
MAFSLEHRAALGDDIVRVMTEQLDHAVEALDELDDPTDAIHECRTRCKKIRGVVRLVRPALDDDVYHRVNDLARDAARSLAASRDATAMSQAFERLTERLGEDAPAPDLTEPVAAELRARRSAAEDEGDDLRADVEEALGLLARLADAIDDVEPHAEGWSAIGPGLAETYGRGRTAMRDAIDGPTGPRFHEWRKRAKYTRYHLDLLTPAAPLVLDQLESAFHDLSDALGDAHDLVVLGTWLRSDEAAALDDDLTTVRVVVDGARVELERRAVALGRRLYAESPKRFGHRIGTYWEVWTDEDAPG